jgi:hypothetical protein
MGLHNLFILVVVTWTYALYKPARARSLRAASVRDTFELGNEINRAAFHSAFITPEGFGQVNFGLRLLEGKRQLYY